MRVLFLQQQPCVRALKYAVGLEGEVELGFAYRGRTLSDLYGAGGSSPSGYQASNSSSPAP